MVGGTDTKQSLALRKQIMMTMAITQVVKAKN